jgi:hypothetical protein
MKKIKEFIKNFYEKNGIIKIMFSFLLVSIGLLFKTDNYYLMMLLNIITYIGIFYIVSFIFLITIIGIINSIKDRINK